jgi:hypothetical protein
MVQAAKKLLELMKAQPEKTEAAMKENEKEASLR